jgi:hypothetical protein
MSHSQTDADWFRSRILCHSQNNHTEEELALMSDGDIRTLYAHLHGGDAGFGEENLALARYGKKADADSRPHKRGWE